MIQSGKLHILDLQSLIVEFNPADQMAWNRWYAFRSYLRSSLWIVPFIALLLEQAAFRVINALDPRITWIAAWPLGLSGTQTALQTIITLILSFLVFSFGSLLVAVQVASGQLTPRIMATTLLRDNVIRFTVRLHRSGGRERQRPGPRE